MLKKLSIAALALTLSVSAFAKESLLERINNKGFTITLCT
ncbi:hypothetical protein HPFOLIGI_02226 [Mannheimia haemolytica]